MPPMAMALFVRVWEEEEVSEHVMLFVCVGAGGWREAKRLYAIVALLLHLFEGP